uniref:Protein MOR1 isoform X1 n=1 Tax=Tanacetum cinerariifolium TaxID=118510 RepID=A0A6L2K594_TANCI|nr:protein MOR1 isoform X1 [Tanacetum cinerariifolium]
MVFKIDFEKAFDTISWDFLFQVMHFMGFNATWIKWISGCLHSASASILINGSTTCEFNILRGLRQGDPLSPFLFIIAMEGLHVAMKDAMAAGSSSLKQQFPRLFRLALNKDVSVRDCWNNGWHIVWSRNVSYGNTANLLDNLLNLLKNSTLNDSDDAWVWYSGNSSFTVKDARGKIDDVYLPDDGSETRWNRFVPEKEELHISSNKKAITEVVCSVVLRALWNFRNDMIFGDIHPKCSILYDKVVEFSFRWYSSRNKLSSISWSNWIQNPIEKEHKTHTSIMSFLSYEDWQLKESKRFCWEDRLLHMNSKVRYAGNIDLKLLCDSITDPKDHRIHDLGYLFKETVSESDVPVQDKALDALIAYLKATDAHVAGRYASEICDAIVAECLTDRPETVNKAQIAFMLWVELEAVDAVLDAMEKAIKTQVAKAVLPALDVMFQAISEFGATIVPPNRLLKMLLEIYDHQDQKVCASSKRLTLELCRWIGRDPVKSILSEKMSGTMKKELDAELANVTVAAKPTRKLRSEQVKEPEQQVATDATRSGPSEESAAEIPLEKDEYELADPDDILTPLEKSGFWNKVKSKKWNQRKEAVAKLTTLASTKRIAPGDFTELCCILKQLITDQSISVRVEAVRAIGNLALGLRISFFSYSHILLPVLLANLREKKPIMMEVLTNTLQAMHKAGCVTLANILTDVKVAVKSKDPHVCSQTLNWVMHCIASSNKVVIRKVHEDYVQICLECLNDGTAEVRDAALSVLVAIAKSVGMGHLNIPLEKLDDVRREKPSEMIGVSGGGAPTVARHGIMKQGLSRKRIAEPSEMTQLKNAAWKELLEETNQPEKMPLSNSQEQKKKRKQHYGSEYGYQHYSKSFPPFWRGDDFFERLFTDEKLAETLKEQQEWVKSHECTRCGLVYDISCDCQQVFEFDMDEMPSSGMFSYGAAETLPRGPDPDPWCPPWE